MGWSSSFHVSCNDDDGDKDDNDDLTILESLTMFQPKALMIRYTNVKSY